jgi:hypothetical protein
MEEGRIYPREYVESIRIGITGGIVAWSCCITGIVFYLLGFSAIGAFFSAIQDKYHWWLVTASVFLLDFSFLAMFKRNHGTCTLKNARLQIAPTAVVILTFLVIYFLFSAILPPLGKLVMMRAS